MSVYRAHPTLRFLSCSLHPQLPRFWEPAGKGKPNEQEFGFKAVALASTAGLDRHLACGAHATRLSPLFPRVLQGGGVTLSAPSGTFTFLCARSVNFRGAGVARGQQTRRDRPWGLRDFEDSKEPRPPSAVAPFPPVPPPPSPPPPPPPQSAEPAAAAPRLAPGWGPAPGSRDGWGSWVGGSLRPSSVGLQGPHRGKRPRSARPVAGSLEPGAGAGGEQAGERWRPRT